MRLLNPGPVTLTERVRRSLLQPDLCHRESEFFDLQEEIRRRLLAVYGLDPAAWTAVLLSASGTGRHPGHDGPTSSTSSRCGPKRSTKDVRAVGVARCSRRSARIACASSSTTTRSGVGSTTTPSTSCSASRSFMCRIGSWLTDTNPPAGV